MFLTTALLALACPSPVGAAPTPEFALGFSPVQPDVDYSKPAKAEIPNCTVRGDHYGTGTAWFLRDADGQLLRRFADTNGDNQVDQWSYFKDGVEVYRDIDADFNKEADQFRWFHSAGTRWGLDSNEDKKIDAWKVISAQEVAEEAINALRTKNAARFALLLVSEDELEDLGLGEQQTRTLSQQVSGALSKFKQFASSQTKLSEKATFVDFGASRPATVPAGANGSEKDLTIYEDVTALVDLGDDHAQVFLGTLVAVDNGWRLLDAPSFDDSRSASFSLVASSTAGLAPTVPAGAPSEQMQELMDKLQRLDAEAAKLSPERQGRYITEQIKLLENLAEITEDPALRAQWYQQMADMLLAAVQGGGYEEGIQLLDRLEKRLDAAGAGDDLVSYARFRRLQADYMHRQQQPDAEFVKVQADWLKDMEAFADEYPRSPDAAEALLQLAISEDFSGKSEAAEKWYQRVVKDFPQTNNGKKAAGALVRLNSEGKAIRLQGSALRGGQVDLASYRGKMVLIQYWATWCEPCKADMAHMKEVFAKHRSRGFEIIGVCLDDDAGPAQAFVAQAKLPWKNVYEPGGLNGRLANELGVTTLPLMMLVDQRGLVARRTLQAAELEGELQSLGR
jgi:thiol-disulfide isomerase/thioredoxin